MSAWIDKLEKYDKTGGIAGGMFFWIPCLSILFADQLLPEKIILFLVLVSVLSLVGVVAYLHFETRLTPAKKLLFGAIGWLFSLSMILLFVYQYYQ